MSKPNIRILSQPISYQELLSIRRLDVRISGIYKIENLVNHKVYIGQSVHIIRRLNDHISDESNEYLKNSFKKYGFDNFSFEVIKQTYDLNYWEMFLIQIYHATDDKYGYNVVEGGQFGCTGGRWHERFLEVINSPGYRKSLSNAQKKRWESEKEKERYSNICSNQWNNPEIREKRIKSRIGRQVSEETRRKIGKTNHERMTSKHYHWYNNGAESKLLSICPDGWKSGRINFNISKPGKPLSEKRKKRLSEINTGLRTWNNGKVQIRSKVKPGDDFILGCLNKRDTHWFTNGTEEIYCKDCPEGFKPGRVSRKRDSVCHFYNNGIITIRCETCPEGFVPGMLKRKKN